MHEIHMNVGITLILKLEFATTTNEIQRNWEILLRLMEFCIEYLYQNKSESISTIIMIFQSDWVLKMDSGFNLLHEIKT